jgi:hypothetical protein
MFDDECFKPTLKASDLLNGKFDFVNICLVLSLRCDILE